MTSRRQLFAHGVNSEKSWRKTHRSAGPGGVQEALNYRSNKRREGLPRILIATRPSTASRPSMMRWSYDMAGHHRAHHDLSDSTTARSLVACAPRMADCGGLMMGMDVVEPKVPPLEIEKAASHLPRCPACPGGLLAISQSSSRCRQSSSGEHCADRHHQAARAATGDADVEVAVMTMSLPSTEAFGAGNFFRACTAALTKRT